MLLASVGRPQTLAPNRPGARVTFRGREGEEEQVVWFGGRGAQKRLAEPRFFRLVYWRAATAARAQAARMADHLRSQERKPKKPTVPPPLRRRPGARRCEEGCEGPW